jgi:GntR family transcriptional repressor for pyruvate dehydrogenase complex
MKIETVKAQRLYRQVANQLRALIRQGTPAPGERLPSERDLAERFGVARPTIREAMIALEIAGVVQIRSGSGVYVLAPEDKALPSLPDTGFGPFEILEARMALEGESCALAAERISPEQLLALERALEKMEKENLQQTVTEQADEEFHCLIAEATGNSAITGTVSWLWKLRNESEISTHFHQRLRRDGSRPIVDDHRQIFAAITARDPEAARQAMRNHLQRVIDTLLASK